MVRRSIAHQRGDDFADTESFSDMRSSLGIFALLAALSCGDSTGPAGAIIGRWETPPRDIGSGYSVVETVNFRSDRTLENEMRVYVRDRLESTHRSTFFYTVRDDSLFTSDRPTMDVLYWPKFNRGRFTIDGPRLVITYPWFGPADEPITVTTIFFRGACMPPVLARCF